MLKILKSKIFWGLLLVCLIGVFLRSYNFSDNIFFETDQARDYQNIDEVLTGGLSDFPLVGPKAQTTFFRLGPFFYIPALVSSWILGLSIFSVALPDLLFSILTIPLFYFFLREFFSKRISLYSTALFSTSLFAVEFSHFSWNPNSVPFFILLAFYSLLRYSRTDCRDTINRVSTGRERLIKNLKKLDNKIFWIILLAMATSISMQLHTITFVGMPLIISLYFIFAKLKFSWRDFFIFGAVSIFFFLPLIFSDILTKGENTQEFFKATIRRSSSDNEEVVIPKQAFMNLYNFTQFYALILSSNDVISKPIRVESSQNLAELISVNFSNGVLRNNILKAILIFIALMVILILFLKTYITKRKNGYFKININQYNFILLILIWQIIFLLLFYPLAIKVDARYFLVILFIPFISLAFIFWLIEKYFKKFGGKIILVITMILFLLNFYQTFRWLKLVDGYSEENFQIDEIILESYFRITAKQWSAITDEIEAEFGSKKFSNIYVKAHPHHTKSLLYFPRIDRNLPMTRIILEDLDADGLYFILRESDKIKTKGKLPEKFKEYFEIVNEANFGTVTLIQLELKNKEIYPKKERIDFEYKQSVNRCYNQEVDFGERAKCTVRDIGKIFE